MEILTFGGLPKAWSRSNMEASSFGLWMYKQALKTVVVPEYGKLSSSLIRTACDSFLNSRKAILISKVGHKDSTHKNEENYDICSKQNHYNPSN